MRGRDPLWQRKRTRAALALLTVLAGVPALAAGCAHAGGSAARAAAASPAAARDTAGIAAQLMAADRAFGAATAARGLDGWMSYFAPDAVTLTRFANPIRGYEAIRKADADNFSNPAVRLTWDPVDAGAYSDGAHGWTIGHYEVHRRAADGSDTVAVHGRYLTVWRRAPDGRWLVVLDTGAPDAP